MENFTRNKILEMSDSLKRLAAIYGRWNFGGIIKNVLCDMESVRKEQKIMQEKLLYLQVKSELKAAKSGKKP